MSRRRERPAWFKLFLHVMPVAEAVPDEAAGQAVKAALRYFDSGVMPAESEMPPLARVLFAALVPAVDESMEDFRRTSEQNRENARKRWQNREDAGASDGMREDAGDAEAEAEKEAEAEAEGEGEERGQAGTPAEDAGGPVPPAPDSVREFFKTLGTGADPDRFTDYYAARGWLLGGRPMRDWRAAARTWVRREGQFGPPGGQASPGARDEPRLRPPAAGDPQTSSGARDERQTMEQVRRLRRRINEAAEKPAAPGPSG